MQRPKEALASAWKSITNSNKRSGFHHIEDDQRQLRGWDPGATELGPLTPSPSYAQFRDKVALTSKTSFSKKSQQLGKQTILQRGWRSGTINGAFSVTIVFLLNLIVTAWGTAHKNAGQEFVFKDECDKINRLNTWLHLLINLLSTILLSASNYCMQCLSAPTRSDVDKAHAKGMWVDIGVSSLRNLRFISKRRVLIWAMLGFSSLPLHLFYNSMVYSSIASHDYVAVNVPEAFKNDQECLNCDKIPVRVGKNCLNCVNHTITDDGFEMWTQYYTEKENVIGAYAKRAIIDLYNQARNGSLLELQPKDCFSEYAKPIQSSRRNVLLVGSDDSFPSMDVDRPSNIGRALFNDTRVYDISGFSSISARYTSDSIDAYRWMCEEIKTPAPNLDSCLSQMGVSEWRVNGFKVDYCLSERAPPVCKLHILLSVGWLVTFLNLLKALLIYYTALMIKEQPLMTIGDAVASFIERPDPRTKNSCLLTIKDVKSKQPQSTLAGPKPWIAKADCWKDVTSKSRRVSMVAMFMIALVTVSGLLAAGVRVLKANGRSTSLRALAKMGFGAVDPQTIITWNLRETIENVLMANLAQPILSLLYFTYNGLFTSMLLGFEWSQYAHKRKGLRVSSEPSGAQRSTYFLQLPYRYSLPLMGLSGILHWLVSQSIFLVAIDLYGVVNGGTAIGTYYTSKNIMSCGYSPIAIVFVLVLGILMLIAGIGFGYIPYKPGINLAGSCSLAISAACHTTEWDLVNRYDTTQSELQWGVVGEGEDGVGHCAFSARDVTFPEGGKTYA